MNPLQSRKKLLLAESELNRVQLAHEWRTLAGEAHTLTGQARTIGTIVSAAASLVTGRWPFPHKKPAPADNRPSWLQTILKGAGFISTILTAFRPQHRDCDDS